MPKSTFFVFALVLMALGLSLIYWLMSLHMNNSNDIALTKAPVPESAPVATLAGGCFWCIESAYEGGMAGIYEAVSGFSGGKSSDASYRLVSQGDTGHKEAVQVFYDPEVVSYTEILDVFWQQIDPTDDGGQFADRGDHYRTAIFYHDESQKEQALASKQALIDSGKFDQPIVTEILPYADFFAAEESHQDFAKKQSSYYQRYKTGSGRAGYIDRVWEGPS